MYKIWTKFQIMWVEKVTLWPFSTTALQMPFSKSLKAIGMGACAQHRTHYTVAAAVT